MGSVAWRRGARADALLRERLDDEASARRQRPVHAAVAHGDAREERVRAADPREAVRPQPGARAPGLDGLPCDRQRHLHAGADAGPGLGAEPLAVIRRVAALPLERDDRTEREAEDERVAGAGVEARRQARVAVERDAEGTPPPNGPSSSIRPLPTTWPLCPAAGGRYPSTRSARPGGPSSMGTCTTRPPEASRASVGIPTPAKAPVAITERRTRSASKASSGTPTRRPLARRANASEARRAPTRTTRARGTRGPSRTRTRMRYARGSPDDGFGRDARVGVAPPAHALGQPREVGGEGRGVQRRPHAGAPPRDEGLWRERIGHDLDSADEHARPGRDGHASGRHRVHAGEDVAVAHEEGQGASGGVAFETCPSVSPEARTGSAGHVVPARARTPRGTRGRLVS